MAIADCISACPTPPLCLQSSMILLISKQPLQEWFFLMLGAIGPYFLTLRNLCFIYCLFFFFFKFSSFFSGPVLLELVHLLTYFCFHLVGSYSSFKNQFQVFQIPFFWSLLSFSQKNFDTSSSEDLHT